MPHKLTVRLLNSNVESDIESGERLEALSFYVDSGKATIGASGAFGMESEYEYDYSGSYLKDGIELELYPETKEHTFTFAVAWLKNCTEQTDTQTWLAVDLVLW